MVQDLKTASVLAFERKFDLSDAIFFSGKWEKRGKNFQEDEGFSPIQLREKAVRGTISNRLSKKESDPAKLDAKIDKANLQRVDVATLFPEEDTLKAVFSLRILPGVGQPSACNNHAYEQKLLKTVETFLEGDGISDLAWRYAWNLASGRFLWRNRLGAQEVEIRVAQIKQGKPEKTWVFPALDYSLAGFEETPQSSQDKLKDLAKLIEAVLKGGQSELFVIEAFVCAGLGQEVYPSQELVLDDSGSDRGKKSRVLYEVEMKGQKVAGMHSQKLGNALRTIDSWYPDSEENGNRPIAAEPYGAVTVQGRAWRQPKAKADFYSLLDQWLLKDKIPPLEDQKFVMSILIRGGVFGDAGKE
ncbi:type I-F CRISPR-associated protein Csy3 [Acetobacteraceae bacterium]|nr:type I-F CRISPR-associated protein Csy3 [Acetobacteraceae bacterium]